MRVFGPNQGAVAVAVTRLHPRGTGKEAGGANLEATRAARCAKGMAGEPGRSRAGQLTRGEKRDEAETAGCSLAPEDAHRARPGDAAHDRGAAVHHGRG